MFHDAISKHFLRLQFVCIIYNQDHKFSFRKLITVNLVTQSLIVFLKRKNKQFYRFYF
jgi:hypothetical protein